MHRFQFHFLACTLALAGHLDPGLAQSPDTAAAKPVLTSTNAPAGTNAAAVADQPVIDPETRELKPRDVFRYRVHQDPVGGVDSLRVTINDAGEALFNVTRADSTYVTVKAAGKRVGEVRELLRKQLEAEYYVTATVDLSLESVAASGLGSGGIAGTSSLADIPKVIVFDQHQGTYPILEGRRLMLSDIMIQMPQSPFANRAKVEILRLGADGKPLPPIRVNVDDLILKNDRSLDVELKDGDRIRVPKKVIFGL